MAKREKGGFWVGVAAAIVYPLSGLLGRRKYLHGDRIPREGAALLVMNHISHLDPIYDAVFTHRNGRVPHFLAKHSLWNIPIAGRILRGAKQIPVYRGTSDAQQSLRAAHEALADGQVVVIYPEGTITKDPDAWPMNSRTGVARLALQHDGPVIPIARWGTVDIYDHYKKRFRPFPRKTVTYLVGEPIDLSEFKAREESLAVLREVTDLLMTNVKGLLSEVRGVEAPEGFYGPRKA
ncbi:lysophospholipid acyltransferase family protein [Lentzea sp. NBRC 102530]|uniref:lysophospholipid acyltransferase family protein n=1 Tax=Lentzea sp. NBRC 102530 TaxID=3032201 RepID=UPI0024A18695|nr:lysophospholipid acyltransferase family protein [Lentzea sp. NBRC 102530]GLY53998.1 1-acyl-sn-glycerol-3-phosphate acyltransferase [Lentzea sp. NBRC 102530]